MTRDNREIVGVVGGTLVAVLLCAVLVLLGLNPGFFGGMALGITGSATGALIMSWRDS